MHFSVMAMPNPGPGATWVRRGTGEQPSTAQAKLRLCRPGAPDGAHVQALASNLRAQLSRLVASRATPPDVCFAALMGCATVHVDAAAALLEQPARPLVASAAVASAAAAAHGPGLAAPAPEKHFGLELLHEARALLQAVLDDAAAQGGPGAAGGDVGRALGVPGPAHLGLGQLSDLVAMRQQVRPGASNSKEEGGGCMLLGRV